MATILITGGSGLLGTALTNALLADGHQVRHLGRGPSSRTDVKGFIWNVHEGTVDAEALKGVDHIVHLAGAGIADKRWTKKRVVELIDSRAASARLLLHEAARMEVQPLSMVSAAGTGYYGAVTRSRAFTEEDPPGMDTIARISTLWEEAVDEWSNRCRVVKLRTPIVLSPQGGALGSLRRIVGLGLGAPLGTGEQWMPWVHIDDLVALYRKALFDDRMQGAYNANNGHDVRNAEFLFTLAKVMRRPFFLPPVPGFLLRWVLGGVSTVLLEGSRVNNQRSLSTGFRYQHLELEATLRKLLGKQP